MEFVQHCVGERGAFREFEDVGTSPRIFTRGATTFGNSLRDRHETPL